MGKVTTVHTVLQGALDELADKPAPPYHGGVDAKPKLGVLGHAGVALMLADAVAKHVAKADRERFERWSTTARHVYDHHLRGDVTVVKGDTWTRRSLEAKAKAALQKELNQGKWGASYLPEQPLVRGLSTPLHVGFVAALLAFDLEVGHAGGGPDSTFALRASAGLAARLVGAPLVPALDAAMLREELRNMLAERSDPHASDVTACLWRAAKDRKVTHVLGRLASSELLLTFKQGARWRVFAGPRDEVLATVPDAQFEAAIEAALR